MRGRPRLAVGAVPRASSPASRRSGAGRSRGGTAAAGGGAAVPRAWPAGRRAGRRLPPGVDRCWCVWGERPVASGGGPPARGAGHRRRSAGGRGRGIDRTGRARRRRRRRRGGPGGLGAPADGGGRTGRGLRSPPRRPHEGGRHWAWGGGRGGPSRAEAAADHPSGWGAAAAAASPPGALTLPRRVAAGATSAGTAVGMGPPRAAAVGQAHGVGRGGRRGQRPCSGGRGGHRRRRRAGPAPPPRGNFSAASGR